MSIVIPSIRAALLSGRNSVLVPNLLTLSGGLITDAIRLANTEGDGATTPGGVGIYEAYTNDCINGNAATNTTGWSLFNGAEALTRDTTPANAVFGSTSFKVVTTGLTSDGVYYNVTGLTAGTVKTCSLTGRFNAGRAYRLLAIDNGGTTVATTTFTGTGARQTVSVTGTVPVGKTALAFTLLVNQSGVDTWYFGGVEINTGSIAFPYKHTNGSTATNTAGRLQMPASYLNATQGWAAFRVKMGLSSTEVASYNAVINIGYDVNNRLVVGAEAGGFWHLYSTVAGVSVGPAIAQVFARDSVHSVILSWTSTTVYLSIDASVFSSSLRTNGIQSGTTLTVDIGSYIGASQWFDGTILAAAFGTGTATNADALTIQNLLTIGARPEAYPQSLQVTAAGPLIDSSFYKST